MPGGAYAQGGVVGCALCRSHTRSLGHLWNEPPTNLSPSWRRNDAGLRNVLCCLLMQPGPAKQVHRQTGQEDSAVTGADARAPSLANIGKEDGKEATMCLLKTRKHMQTQSRAGLAHRVEKSDRTGSKFLRGSSLDTRAREQSRSRGAGAPTLSKTRKPMAARSDLCEWEGAFVPSPAT